MILKSYEFMNHGVKIEDKGHEEQEIRFSKGKLISTKNGNNIVYTTVTFVV